MPKTPASSDNDGIVLRGINCIGLDIEQSAPSGEQTKPWRCGCQWLIAASAAVCAVFVLREFTMQGTGTLWSLLSKLVISFLFIKPIAFWVAMRRALVWCDRTTYACSFSTCCEAKICNSVLQHPCLRAQLWLGLRTVSHLSSKVPKLLWWTTSLNSVSSLSHAALTVLLTLSHSCSSCPGFAKTHRKSTWSWVTRQK